MTTSQVPLFPAFAPSGHSWITSAHLAAWSGFGPRAAFNNDLIEIVFAPEGWNGAALTDRECGLVRWFIDSQAAVHDVMLERLFDEYPSIRGQLRGYFGKEERKEILPKIREPMQLKKLTGFPAIYVHQVEKDGKPFIGVQLRCTWDEEHGVGILLHGTEVLVIGGGDTARTLWIAKRYVKS